MSSAHFCHAGGRPRCVCRYAAGPTPRRACRWFRRVSALPRPVCAATTSTVRSVVSSRHSAACTRVSASQRAGVAPVAARKRRANVRSLITASRARRGTGHGSAKQARTRSIALPNASSPARRGTGASANCAWPPSRNELTTMCRASRFAPCGPCAARTTCRQASIPAAVPALVVTGPSETNRTRIHLHERVALLE